MIYEVEWRNHGADRVRRAAPRTVKDFKLLLRNVHLSRLQLAGAVADWWLSHRHRHEVLTVDYHPGRQAVYQGDGDDGTRPAPLTKHCSLGIVLAARASACEPFQILLRRTSILSIGSCIFMSGT